MLVMEFEIHTKLARCFAAIAYSSKSPFATRLATYIVAIAATCRTNSATRKMLHHHYSRDKKHVNVATIEIGNWLQLRLVTLATTEIGNWQL